MGLTFIQIFLRNPVPSLGGELGIFAFTFIFSQCPRPLGYCATKYNICIQINLTQPDQALSFILASAFSDESVISKSLQSRIYASKMFSKSAFQFNKAFRYLSLCRSPPSNATRNGTLFSSIYLRKLPKALRIQLQF